MDPTAIGGWENRLIQLHQGHGVPYYTAMSDVTQLLQAIDSGRPQAAEELLPLVYEELRKLAAAKMAQESPGQTLQATALVHEAWLRLVHSPQQNWQNRAHFFRTAAECMRRILIDNARRKQQVCRGGGLQRMPLEGFEFAEKTDPERLLQINEALERLAALDVTKAEVVKLKFFGGLEHREIAEIMGVSERTVERAWRFAKAWLLTELHTGL